MIDVLALLSPPERFGRTTGDVLDERIVLRVEPCACGTAIRADRSDQMQAVMRHNRSAAHVRWWARHRLEWQGDE